MKHFHQTIILKGIIHLAKNSKYYEFGEIKIRDKFNKYELEKLKALDYKQKLSIFFELFNHTYSIYTKQEIEKFYNKKLQRLFLSQKLVLTLK